MAAFSTEMTSRQLDQEKLELERARTLVHKEDKDWIEPNRVRAEKVGLESKAAITRKYKGLHNTQVTPSSISNRHESDIHYFLFPHGVSLSLPDERSHLTGYCIIVQQTEPLTGPSVLLEVCIQTN